MYSVGIVPRKYHGVIPPYTPCGWRMENIRVFRSSELNDGVSSRLISAAVLWNISTMSSSSAYALASGFP